MRVTALFLVRLHISYLKWSWYSEMMTENIILREELLFHLTYGNAHMPFEEAVSDFPEDKMNAVFPNGEYTFWHLLEHIRRTQNDILDFITNPDYKEREWPKAYWPQVDETAAVKDWEKTITSYRADRDGLTKVVQDPATDLFKKIPHGTGQTILREIMVVSDHTAYHIGEFAIMRQVLGAWNRKT